MNKDSPGLTNVHIYNSPFKNESRILKITKTLADSKIFNKIIIMAIKEKGLSDVEMLDETREVVRLGRNFSCGQRSAFNKVIHLLEWSCKLIFYLRREKIDCINCHSLPMLPLCLILKIIKRAKLIYDTHELETESAGAKGLRKYVLKFAERIMIPFADEIIVVNESISEWYRREYALQRVWIVRNVPYAQKIIPQTTFLREAFGIREEDILFLYQGLISGGRGIELLLESFSKNGTKHLVFMGYGDLTETVIKYASQCKNIHYYPAVKPEDVVYYTVSADIGLALIEDVCLSYYYCLPNKIYEYINCGLPVIVSDFPEMGKVIDEYVCGWKCEPTEAAVIGLIEQMTKDDIEEKRACAIAAREHFGWHLEEPVILDVYRHLGLLKDIDQVQ